MLLQCLLWARYALCCLGVRGFLVMSEPDIFHIKSNL